MNRSAMLPTSEFTFPGSLGLDDFLKMQSGDDMTESQALLASLLDTPPLELPDETKRKVSTDYDEIAVQNPSKFTHGNAVDNVEHDQDDMDGEQDHPQKKKPGRKPLTTAPNSVGTISVHLTTPDPICRSVKHKIVQPKEPFVSAKNATSKISKTRCPNWRMSLLTCLKKINCFDP